MSSSVLFSSGAMMSGGGGGGGEHPDQMLERGLRLIERAFLQKVLPSPLVCVGVVWWCCGRCLLVVSWADTHMACSLVSDCIAFVCFFLCGCVIVGGFFSVRVL